MTTYVNLVILDWHSIFSLDFRSISSLVSSSIFTSICCVVGHSVLSSFVFFNFWGGWVLFESIVLFLQQGHVGKSYFLEFLHFQSLVEGYRHLQSDVNQ